MAEQINLNAAGLYLDANPLSQAPAGAMSIARDVVISRPGVVESRLGFACYLESTPVDVEALTFYLGTLIGHGSNTLFRRGTDAWTSYTGTITAPTGTGVRVRFAEAAENLYLTSAAGIWRLDAVDGTPAKAGAPKALDPTLAISSTSAGLWLTAAHQVAYYLTWAITDANGNLHEGAPSGRVVIDNTGATDATVDVTVPILSSEMTTAHVFTLYRTGIQASGTDPGAEAQLVYRRSPTSDEVTAGTLTFEDIVPDALRAATAYFAPSQEGILSGNDSPPLAKDLCLFRGTMFYANTTSRQRLQLSLLAVGGTDGLQANGTVTINGVTYTAKASPSAATDFQIATSGTVSQNIEATARALIAAVNAYTAANAGTIGAYYLSGELDAPGKMLFEERGLGGDAFSAVASAHGDAWSPQLPTSGATVSSTADVKKNRLCWSKLQQPEAVPLLNFVDVGSGNAQILRILALRDSLIILKEDGAFRLTGDAGFFRVDLLDSTVILYARESAQVVNGRVFAWCTQGVMAISDTGAESLSAGRIDEALRTLSANYGNGASAYENGGGVGSDVAHCYLVGGGNMYRYNYLTDSWTTLETPSNPGNAICRWAQAPDGTIYAAMTAGGLSAGRVLHERTDPTDALTYWDASQLLNVTNVASNTEITVANGDGVTLQPGDIVWQGAGKYAVAETVTLDESEATATVTFATGASWATGHANALTALSVSVEYLPATAGTASAKQFTDCVLLFEGTPPSSITVTFATDLGASASVTLAPALSSNPGELWTWVPPECQRCGRLTVQVEHSVAGERFRLLGVSLKARVLAERRFGR